MTRKDFEKIAETIRNLHIETNELVNVARQFADSLQSTNPAFDRERFLTSALPTGYYRKGL